MLKNIILWLLAVVFLAGVGAVYGGIGWGIAWVIAAIFKVNVNYTIFVLVALGIFVLTVIPYVIFGILAKRQKEAIEREFHTFNSFNDW